MKQYTLGSVSISDRAQQYVSQVLDSTLVGPFNFTKRVAEETAKLHNYTFGHCLNSGQSALTIALRAIKKKHNMKHRPLVLTPAITYISTQASCYFANCDIGLVDVNIEDGNMNVDSLIKHLDEYNYKTVIVMPVHLAGKLCDRRIFDICQERDIPTVVDSCEMFAGAKYGVDWGDIICLSSFSNHHVGAGQGGYCVTNDPELDLYLFQQINHGRHDDRKLGSGPGDMANRFRFLDWGESLKFNDLSAALVLAQIEELDTTLSRYIENARLLSSLLIEDKFILPKGDNHTYMFYPIIMKNNKGATDIVKHINANGIYTRWFMQITNQKVILDYYNLSQKEIDIAYTNAAYLNQNAFYVGCHPALSLDDIKEMASIINAA